MVWNEKLKREIPQGWSHGSLLDIANYTNGLACQKFRPTDERKLPVIKIKEMHDGFSSETEYVTADISESVKVYDGDVLFSWSASLEVMLWACGNGGLNQHIFKVTSKNGYPKSFYYYQLLNYIAHFKRMAEARKTTMGHITQEHLQQSIIVLPPDLTIPNQLEVRISPILEQIVLNNQEIIKLTRQRDELLPLLMNGQVSVTQLNNDLATSTEKDTQCVHFCGLFRLLVTCAMIEMLYDRIFCGHRMEIVIFSYICGAVAEKIASAQT